MAFFHTLGGHFFRISKNLMDQFFVDQYSWWTFFRGRFYRGPRYPPNGIMALYKFRTVRLLVLSLLDLLPTDYISVFD